MKKIKISFFKKYNAVLNFFVTILGFGAACSFSSCMYGDPTVEYGTPYATFKVKGSVKSEITSNAIPNIRVVMRNDTAYTDASGNYQVSNEEFPEDQVFELKFEDIDGETNGVYQPLDTIVEFTDPEFSGSSDDWYSGDTEKEIDIKLKNKD